MKDRGMFIEAVVVATGVKLIPQVSNFSNYRSPYVYALLALLVLLRLNASRQTI